MLRKIIVLVLIILFTCIYFSETSLAVDNIIKSAEDFVSGTVQDTPLDEASLKATSSYLYNVLFTIAVVLSIAVGLIIGIQFVLGSVEEQAKIKETLIPYVIGVFVVFASFTIWKIAINIGKQVAPVTATTTTTLPPQISIEDPRRPGENLELY